MTITWLATLPLPTVEGYSIRPGEGLAPTLERRHGLDPAVGDSL